MSRFSALSVLAAASLSGCAWLNRKLLYVPEARLHGTPRLVGLAFEDVPLKAADGVRLSAWYVPGGESQPVLLLSHGNGGNMSHRLEKLKLLRAAGAGVLMYDYRGYGASAGKPSEDGTYADGEAALAWLKGRVPPSRIVLMGESLGCGVAVELAKRHPEVRALVLDSAFTSTLAMGKRLFPHLPVSRLVRYRYDNLAKIPDVKLPTLVMHSREDDIVPYDMGRALYDAAPGPKSFVDLHGSHNEGFWDSQKEYVAGLRGFLASLR